MREMKERKVIELDLSLEVSDSLDDEEFTEFARVEDFTTELFEEVREREHILVILVETPLTSQVKQILEILPRSSYLCGWAFPKGYFETLDTFKKWYLDRVQKDVEWFVPVGAPVRRRSGE